MVTEFQMPAASGDNSAYCTREEVELIFGQANVEAWADIDNDEDEDFIAARVAWAIRRASSRVDDALRGGPYAVPFTAPYPECVVDATARMAGVLLFDGRGIEDEDSEGEPRSSVSPHEDMARKTLRRVLTGQITLPGVESKSRVPSIITLADAEVTDDGTI